MSDAERRVNRADRDEETSSKVRTATEIAVRIGLLALIAAWCLQIVAPFVGIIVWALVIAIAATPAHEKLTGLLGGRRSAAAVLFVLGALIGLIVPAVMLSETLVSGAQDFAERIRGDGLSIPPPPEAVATWPLVGEPIHDAWQLASENLEEALRRVGPQLEALSLTLLSAVGSVGLGLMQLLISLLLSGFLLAHGEARETAIARLANRLAGKQGVELARLANATVRNVVRGILGVALIQAVFAGLDFIVVGVPAAGLWALLVLVAAVVQLPVLLAMIPPILIVFSSESTAVAVGFMIWSVSVSLLDNILKPILFGRGAQVPTIVIFIGAIGGMLAMGILGLFVGAVVLAVSYEIFGAWLSQEGEEGPVAEVD